MERINYVLTRGTSTVRISHPGASPEIAAQIHAMLDKIRRDGWRVSAGAS